MSLSVCLLLDDAADRAVRSLWQRLEDAGIPTLLTHTHGRHLPHLTFASLLAYDLDEVRAALTALPSREPATLHLDALGMFRRSRCWLAPAASGELVARQQAVVAALAADGVDLHRNYRADSWMPHLTLAPRLHIDDLPVVARHTFEILPLTATLARAALVDTSTGQLYELPHLV
jgi:2'-5' RNA ligase